MKKKTLITIISAVFMLSVSAVSAAEEASVQATAVPEAVEAEVVQSAPETVETETVQSAPEATMTPEEEKPAVVLESGDYKYLETADGVIIVEYKASGSEVEIPAQINEKNVTEIGTNAFGNKSITSVVIPDTVTKIDSGAFMDCGSLTTVKLSENIQEIGSGAFENCVSLKTINMPSNLVVIYGRAFAECTSLGTVVFPDTLQYLGEGAFYNCTSLNNVEIPKELNDLNGSVFGGCSSLSDITVNAENPYYVSEGNVIYSKDKTILVAFPSAHSGDYTVPEGTLSIGYAAFYKCTGLNNIILPESLKTIENAAFVKCEGITNMSIPSNVTNLGGYAFSGCSSLKNVTVSPAVSEIKEYTFANCSALEHITITSNVSSIGENAFSGCTTACVIETDSSSSAAAEFANNNGMGYKLTNTTEMDGSSVNSTAASVNIVFNGQNFECNPGARIVNDRTMVPMRALFEAMGATVSWNEEERSINASLNDVTIDMKVDSTVMWKNGDEITLDSPAVIIEDRTMVPMRAISEAFGATVEWNEATRTVVVNYTTLAE